MTEREGFEPPEPKGLNGFQDRRFRPLSHLSFCTPFLLVKSQAQHIKLIFIKVLQIQTKKMGVLMLYFSTYCGVSIISNQMHFPLSCICFK